MADRFTTDDFLFKSGLTYSPETFQESLFLPLQYRDREDRLHNEMSDMIVKMSNINVGTNEKAREYFDQFRNKTNEEVNNLTQSLMNNGSLNPNTISNFRNLKTQYAVETSENGRTGQLARLAAQTEQQRGLRMERNLTQGYSDDMFNTAYGSEVDDFYNQNLTNEASWDRFMNDPTYRLPDFNAGYAPENVTVESRVTDLIGKLGSRTKGLKANDITLIPDPNTGLTMLVNQNRGLNQSSNEEALSYMNEYINTQINDLNSPLMQAEMYKIGRNANNISPEELRQLQQKVSYELALNTQMSLTTSEMRDQTISQQVVNPNVGAGANVGRQTKETSEETGQASLTSDVRGLLNVEFNEHTGSLADIATGDSYRKLEAMGNTGNLNGMSEEDHSRNMSMVIGVKKQIEDEYTKVLNNPTQRKEIFSGAATKMMFGGNSTLTSDNRSLFESNSRSLLDRRYVPSSKAANTPLRSYKLPGMDVAVSDMFTNEKHYDKFVNNKDKFNREFDNKYSDLDSQIKGKLINSNALDIYGDLQAYKSSAVGSKPEAIGAIAVLPDGRYLFEANQRNLQLALEQNNINVRDVKISTGTPENLAKLNGVDVNTMKSYLDASTKKNLYNKFDGIFKSNVAELAVKATDVGNLKYDSEVFYFGAGSASNKARSEINETINKNFGNNLFNIAINNDRAKFDGESKSINETYTNSNTMAQAFPDATFELENIVTNNGYSDVQFGIRVTSGTGDKKTSKMMYLPYTGSSNDSALGAILDRMGEVLNPQDAGKIKAMTDNVKTRFLHVDHINTGSAGMSAMQRKQIDRARKEVLDPTILNNKNYKTETEILNRSTRASIVVDNEGYHGMMYDDNGTPTSLSAGRFFRMQSVKQSIKAGTTGTLGYSDLKSINNNFVVSSDQNPAVNQKLTRVKQDNFIQEMFIFSQMYEQGLIKIQGLGPEEQNYFREFRDLMEEAQGALNDNLETKLNLANTIYAAIDRKKIGVKNKTLLL